ncbi:MAG: chromate transporter [Vicinamibacterales bacterium]
MTSASDWYAFVTHFLQLSLLSIGGVITTAPEMHRVLVDQMGLLTDREFSASIAIAQASPGPNVLFVAVLGYQAAGLPGAIAALGAILLPTSALALVAGRWGEQRRNWLTVRAFKAGIAPIVIGLVFATGWLLALETPSWRAGLITSVAMLLVWRTRLHLLIMIGAGAALGALGLI